MRGRVCGTCSLCCKLPYVAELNKPIDNGVSTASQARAAPSTLIAHLTAGGSNAAGSVEKMTTSGTNGFLPVAR